VSLLLLDVALVGGGFLFGRWVMRTMRARAGAAGPSTAGGEEAPPERDPLEGFPCKLGDVLVRPAEGDEAWLAGALVFEEERPVAALFIAPEAGGDRAILVRPRVGEAGVADVAWLAPVDLRDLGGLAGTGATSEPPHTLEHGGSRYARSRRLPVKITRLGTGAPAVGPQAIVAEYSGAGSARLLVVVGVPAGGAKALAWSGVALRDGEYEVLPGDASTREG
jgi:hypothetical protein